MNRLLLCLLATAPLVVGSCKDEQFWCQRTAEEEGRARRCQASKDGCEKYLAQKVGGCDAVAEAWCFHESPMGDLKPELVCAATEADCNSWRKSKKKRDPSECKLTPAGAY